MNFKNSRAYRFYRGFLCNQFEDRGISLHLGSSLETRILGIQARLYSRFANLRDGEL
jgi:hypothetical protein